MVGRPAHAGLQFSGGTSLKRIENKLAMSALMEGRTSFVIAHRLSTIRNTDLILVMQDGDIVESGSHRELLSRKGIYAELYNSQFDEGA